MKHVSSSFKSVYLTDNMLLVLCIDVRKVLTLHVAVKYVQLQLTRIFDQYEISSY